MTTICVIKYLSIKENFIGASTKYKYVIIILSYISLIKFGELTKNEKYRQNIWWFHQNEILHVHTKIEYKVGAFPQIINILKAHIGSK